MALKGRHPRESEAVLTELMMPHHANIMGNVFGGHILALVDRVAAVAAIRHAHRECVTVSVEVGVKVLAEDVLTGDKRHTNSCYVTYVALDENGRPTEVAPVVPETADEKRRYDRAAKRRATRVMERRYDQGRGE